MIKFRCYHFEVLTQERLKELLLYHPESGHFTWRKRTSNRVRVGDRAGRVDGNGYRAIGVDGTLHYEHRLACLYMLGVWPEHDMDHDNRQRDDNRWANLKSETRSGNLQNQGLAPTNKSGYRGVCYHRAAGKWSAERWVQGVKHYLGLFPTPEDAHQAWLKFSVERGLRV